MIDHKQVQAANLLPLNLAALSQLRKTDWPENPERIHAVTLMLWALDNGATIPEMDEAAGHLLQTTSRISPARMTKLVSGESGDDAAVTAEELGEQATPMHAAAMLLEEWSGYSPTIQESQST